MKLCFTKTRNVIDGLRFPRLKQQFPSNLPEILVIPAATYQKGTNLGKLTVIQ